MKVKLYQLILLSVVIIAAAAGFFSYEITREVEIKASMFNLSPQLSDLRQWQKWNKETFGNDSAVKNAKVATAANGGKIKLDVKSPAIFVVSIEKGNNRSIEYINITPSLADTSVLLTWTGQVSGFSWLASNFGHPDKVEKQLIALKQFAENPDAIYGFPIRIVKITDEVLCTTQKTVSKDSIPAESLKMLNSLKAFFKSKGIPVISKYFYISTFAGNSDVQLTVALPVKTQLANENGFKFLKFPTGGRLLTGEFKGAYKDMHLIYAAMDTYVAEHHLMKVAQVLAAYPQATDFTKEVNAKVIYPIY